MAGRSASGRITIPLASAEITSGAGAVHGSEYARHNGHADLLRERIDGTTGV